MLKKKKIIQFINKEENVDIISKEIIKTFKEEANQNNVEYSFDISMGKMKETSDASNTYFVFDTKENTKIDEFKKLLFDKDLENIKDGSDEEKMLMDMVRCFLVKVCEKVSNEYYEDLEEVIRKVVLGHKPGKESKPLNDVKLVMIDVSDFSSIGEAYKYLLIIYRNGEQSEGQSDTDDVILFAQNKKEETGMEYREILEIEKEIGNPLFKNVTDIQMGRKSLNDVTIYMNVDYSC